MEAQQQQMTLETADPGAMIHQPRLAIDESTLAEMRAAVGMVEQPIMHPVPMRQPQQQRDNLAIAMVAGAALTVCASCVAMVAIANNPSAQVARANEQMAAVAIAANQRSTCEINALIALPGACPTQSPEAGQQGSGVVTVANNAPLPAEVPLPPAPNQFVGWSAEELTNHWNWAECVDGSTSQVCADIAAAYSAIAPVVGGGQ